MVKYKVYTVVLRCFKENDFHGFVLFEKNATWFKATPVTVGRNGGVRMRLLSFTVCARSALQMQRKPLLSLGRNPGALRHLSSATIQVT